MLKPVCTAGRILIGLFILSSGALYFLGLEKLPPLKEVVAQDLLDSFRASGLFVIAKALEVAFGLAMLANRFVPLALVAFFPLTVIIAHFDIVLLRGDQYGYYTGGLMLAIHVALLFAYLPYYRAMLSSRAQPDLGFNRNMSR